MAGVQGPQGPQGEPGPPGPQGPPGTDGTCLLDAIRDRIENSTETSGYYVQNVAIKAGGQGYIVGDVITLSPVTDVNMEVSVTSVDADGAVGNIIFPSNFMAAKDFKGTVIATGGAGTGAAFEVTTKFTNTATRSVVCNAEDITVKDGENLLKIKLETPLPNGVLIKVDDTLKFGILNTISKTVIDSTTGTVIGVKSSVTCENDKFIFQVNENTVNLSIDGGADGDVLRKKAQDVIFSPVSTISRNSVNTETGEVTVKSSVTCQEDGIQLQIGENSYLLNLADGVNGDVLQVLGTTLSLGPLSFIELWSPTAEDVILSGVYCNADGITFFTGNNQYLLNLQNGQENSPLIKQGNNIVFGPPLTDQEHNVIITSYADFPASADDADEGAVYFVYDSEDPYVPPTTGD